MSTEISGYDVPIAFFVFNRPSIARRTFEAIAAVKPTKFFIISDGPRSDRPTEALKVMECRDIVKNIDWPCEIYTHFADVNLGCKQRISSGITWVFTQVDRAIILEDDCLPTQSFFSYCRNMLRLYEYDRKIYSISGSYFAGKSNVYGHTFSRYSLMWGWATWADRWQQYILEPKDSTRVLLRTWWNRPITLAYWLLIYRTLASGGIDTWDYQWLLTVWRKKALACRPSQNLVKNLGFGVDATHTLVSTSFYDALKANEAISDYLVRLTTIQPNRLIERADELYWAQISVRSLLIILFPWILHIRSYLRKLRALS